MDSFDAEYERVLGERAERARKGVLSREEAAAGLRDAATAMKREASRLAECWWEDGDAAVFAAVLDAVVAWRAAAAHRDDE